MELAIYFTNGQVAYFKDVKNLDENDGAIRFEYFGQASQRPRTAVFMRRSFSGYSITTDDD